MEAWTRSSLESSARRTDQRSPSPKRATSRRTESTRARTDGSGISTQNQVVRVCLQRCLAIAECRREAPLLAQEIRRRFHGASGELGFVSSPGFVTCDDPLCLVNTMFEVTLGGTLIVPRP